MHKDDQIDTILLACTHYPLIAGQILKYTPKNVQLISQGKIVAESLLNYLQRQQQIEQQCSKKLAQRGQAAGVQAPGHHAQRYQPVGDEPTCRHIHGRKATGHAGRYK